MTSTAEPQVTPAPEPRTRPCAHCGRPVTARKPTGRPPRYCPPDQRDCAARARAERIAARAADTAGGPAALRQSVVELAGHLDEAWEPLQDLVESAQGARTLLTTLRDDLIARVERAEQAAEQATAAREQADQRALAAEVARDDALDQARQARAQRNEALRARDTAEQATQDALRAQERLRAERDAAREQADQAAATAAATVTDITATADRRVQAAADAAAAAREQAAALRAQVESLRDQLRDRDERLHEAAQAADRLRADTEHRLAQAAADATRRIDQAVADAERRVEQARAELAALREQHERRVLDLGRQLGAQTERADRLQRAHDRHRELIDRLLATARTDPATPTQDPADREQADVEHGARNTLHAVIAMLESARVTPDGTEAPSSP
ncbi:chromosome segregation ATPase [Saccharothrix coeruleofusca]|uniref:hypothetical protein n=1 Tax=Saccharothrix coeruleofusca TaxID=33919 RepID=UPI001AE8DEF5|nr:hypothetical protein [Saccharothrix coeruleofusca]MBP2336373.1 chromosome segregation ATPase [Saccharothrix coeruleofusca]